MARVQKESPDIDNLLAQVVAVGETAQNMEQKLQTLEMVRILSREMSRRADMFLLENITSLHSNLNAAMVSQRELRALHEQLTAPPFHPAVFLGAEDVGHGASAMVMYGNSRRVVACGDEVDLDALVPGDEVLLSNEMNFIVARSPFSAFQCGHTATFDRYATDGRVILKDRDEEIVVDIGGALRNEALKNGDQIRWERNSWMALEKIEKPSAESLFLEETPVETFADIGGLDRQIEQLQGPIRLHFFDSEIARKYKLRRVGSVLLWGPPGTGKTMIARALANWLSTLSKSGKARFMHVRPLQLSSMWYSESERNVRSTFRMLREAGDAEPQSPVVAFFDEIDSIGTARGASLTRVDDKVLTSLMAELDGLESRGNVLVVAATNRKDTLDPALIREGRLGDVVIEVPRPNMRAAGEIFSKHLSPEIPYAAEGRSSKEARQFLIESVVSRIYSPNGESEIAQIGFRDGKRRTVKACDLMNGASIAKMVRVGIERACLREVEGGPAGVRIEDLLHGIAEEFECMAKTLTPANCRSHLHDLPQDVDVVRVEPVRKKVTRSYRYISAA